MTIAALVILGIWFLALIDLAHDSFWSRMNRDARRRARELQ